MEFEQSALLQAPSARSVFIEVHDHRDKLATATGFLVKLGSRTALVTNRHVVTGLTQDTKRMLWVNIPEVLKIHFLSQGGVQLSCTIPVLDDFQPLWTEHPTLGCSADIVAISFPKIVEEIDAPATYDLNHDQPEIACQPSDRVNIVGFPFGYRASALPIWSTGFVASEPTLNYDNRPIFLIDSRTRPGQSGSPVIAHRNGGPVLLEDGSVATYDAPVTRLLGIYSGRLSEESDLGLVWKLQAIVEVVQALKSAP